MKKILLLGGSPQQIIAIETARRLGLYTVLCDYLPDNPGQYAADKFYLVSTTDREAVLEVARREQVNGVLAYASDPAAPTAAYVAQELGLPGNPYESVEILCNKDRFRAFLKEHGFCTPEAGGYADVTEALGDIRAGRYHLPVIVKPTDSSGSKGAAVLHTWDELENAAEYALSFSRGHRIIVEEFIEKKHPYLIGGDVFVLDGRVQLWGLLNCHRDSCANPLVPVGKSYPLQLGGPDVERVRSTIQRLVDQLSIKFGAMNVELIVDSRDQVFLIDVGPRSGGNMIPDLLGYIFHVNVTEAAVRTAMGEKISMEPRPSSKCWCTYNLHSTEAGTYEGIQFAPEMERHILRKALYKSIGDHVEFFDNASKALGIIFMTFDDQKEMTDRLDHASEWIKIKLS